MTHKTKFHKVRRFTESGDKPPEYVIT